MSGRGEDPAEVPAGRSERSESWSRVAAGWARHFHVFETAAQGLGDRMVDLAGLRAGGRVLDLATGVGEPALTAARRVGPSGRVLALDHAPAMIALARRRVAEAGLRNVELAEGSAETLGPPGEVFDAVLCRFGLMLFDDPGAALRRARERLVPGGRLVAAVWAVPERVPLIAPIREAIQRVFDPPPPAPGTPGPFAMSDAGALEERVRQAGFGDVFTERVVCRFVFDSPSAYRIVEEDMSQSLSEALAGGTPEQIAECRRLLEEAAARFADAGGRVVMPCESIVVAGRRPVPA